MYAPETLPFGLRTSHFALLFLFVLLSTLAQGQDYFRWQEEPDKFFNQKIARFSNSDILIGDSSIEAQRSGVGGKVFLTRLDPCGKLIWSFSYESAEEYLEFKDFLIGASGEIYVYGSAYIGLDEYIFFLKVTGKGVLTDYRIFKPETVDHFSYSIDWKKGRIMVYGLLLGWATQKQGFVAVFDEKLNLQWARKFSPFESSGKAIITSDDAFLCRSGPYLYKIGSTGLLRWATNLDPRPGTNPIGGPLEAAGGYILQSHRDGYSFFYKVDRDGKPLWKTGRFPSSSAPADLKLLPDGKVLAVYNSAGETETRLCYVMLSPAGEILQQRQLSAERAMRTGTIYQSPGPNNSVTIAGNAELGGGRSGTGFLLQLPLDTQEGECAGWEDIRTVLPNDINLLFNRLDTAMLPATMSRLSIGRINTRPFTPPFDEVCDLTGTTRLTQVDTFLPCGEDWMVSLPSPEFSWEDNSPDNPRLLSEPGAYRARAIRCDAPVVYEYVLKKEDCGCPVFLPDAFSPNQDGINDRLELYGGCDILSVRMTIYSRWGDRLFFADGPAATWNGESKGRPVEPGAYLAVIGYTWIDTEGKTRENSLVQTVTLLK